MKVIVGLGNPEEEYKLTRHNIGFLVIDSVLSIAQVPRLSAKGGSASGGKAQGKLKAEIWEIRDIGKIGEKMVLVKPRTYMNKSGEAVRKVVEYFSGDFKTPDDSLRKTSGVRDSLFVVHDELDLALGKLKIGRNISAAGHHGVESIIEHLGTQDFVRFRVGVADFKRTVLSNLKGLSFQGAEDYLLAKFTKNEMKIIEPAIERTAEAVLYAVEYGVEKAMNNYNG